MPLADEVIRIKKANPEYGRARISKILGVSEKRVRTILEKNRDKVDPTGKTVEYSNGRTTINAKVALSDDELLNPEKMMIACGIDPALFELVSYRHSEWDSMAKIDEKIQTKRMYALKIVVKPKKAVFDIDGLINKLNKLKPIKIEKRPAPIEDYMLEIGTTDLHFPFVDYESLLCNILGLIPGMSQVVLLTGSDNLHVDNLKGMTSNGTQLEPTDLNEAFEQAFAFYSTIIEFAIKHGAEVKVIYVMGNHDETTSFMLAKALEKVYPQAEHDVELKQYKAHRFHDVAIGFTHGNEGKQRDYDRLFLSEYPDIFSGAKTVEIHSGHIHQEKVTDVYGTMLRSLPTNTRRNEWTIKKGLVSKQRFQCFIYSDSELLSINYV